MRVLTTVITHPGGSLTLRATEPRALQLHVYIRAGVYVASPSPLQASTSKKWMKRNKTAMKSTRNQESSWKKPSRLKGKRRKGRGRKSWPCVHHAECLVLVIPSSDQWGADKNLPHCHLNVKRYKIVWAVRGIAKCANNEPQNFLTQSNMRRISIFQVKCSLSKKLEFSTFFNAKFDLFQILWCKHGHTMKNIRSNLQNSLDENWPESDTRKENTPGRVDPVCKWKDKMKCRLWFVYSKKILEKSFIFSRRMVRAVTRYEYVGWFFVWQRSHMTEKNAMSSMSGPSVIIFFITEIIVSSGILNLRVRQDFSEFTHPWHH